MLRNIGRFRAIIGFLANFTASVLSSGGTPYAISMNVLNSSGTSYTVTRSVLSSTGTSYTVV